MKKLVILIAICCTSFYAKAQIVEAKVNPLGLLFNSPDFGVEISTAQRFSVEGTLSFNYVKFANIHTNGIGGRVFGKFYLGNNLEAPLTKLWMGAYICAGTLKIFDKNNSSVFVTNNRVSAGYALGYKWLAGDNVILELALGGGRAFVNDFSDNSNNITLSDIIPYDFYSALKVGWRFGDGGSFK